MFKWFGNVIDNINISGVKRLITINLIQNKNIFVYMCVYCVYLCIYKYTHIQYFENIYMHIFIFI